jgi:molybdopterin-guanine dinucleotide biosynthesis protein A
VSVGGILLTGGASRRLGVDKATLVVDGVTLAVRAASSLIGRGVVAVEVGPGHTALPAVREDPPGTGPLAAFVTGARAVAEALGAAPDAFLLLACDLVDPGVVLDALLAAPRADLVVPVDAEGAPQYVCARYDAALVDVAAGLLAAGERSLRALAATVPADHRHDLAGFAPDALADVDTPADARRWGIESPR